MYCSKLVIQRRNQYIQLKENGQLDDLSRFKAMIIAKEIEMSLDEFFTPPGKVAGDSER